MARDRKEQEINRRGHEGKHRIRDPSGRRMLRAARGVKTKAFRPGVFRRLLCVEYARVFIYPVCKVLLALGRICVHSSRRARGGVLFRKPA